MPMGVSSLNVINIRRRRRQRGYMAKVTRVSTGTQDCSRRCCEAWSNDNNDRGDSSLVVTLAVLLNFVELLDFMSEGQLRMLG